MKKLKSVHWRENHCPNRLILFPVSRKYNLYECKGSHTSQSFINIDDISPNPFSLEEFIVLASTII